MAKVLISEAEYTALKKTKKDWENEGASTAPPSVGPNREKQMEENQEKFTRLWDEKRQSDLSLEGAAAGARNEEDPMLDLNKYLTDSEKRQARHLMAMLSSHPEVFLDQQGFLHVQGKEIGDFLETMHWLFNTPKANPICRSKIFNNFLQKEFRWFQKSPKNPPKQKIKKIQNLQVKKRSPRARVSKKISINPIPKGLSPNIYSNLPP